MSTDNFGSDCRTQLLRILILFISDFHFWGLSEWLNNYKSRNNLQLDVTRNEKANRR